MTRSPGLVPVLFALGGFGVLAILAAAIATPLGPREGFMDGFMDGFMEDFELEDAGNVALTRVEAEAQPQPGSLATDVAVTVGVQADNARGVVLRILVSSQPCSPVGPPDEPNLVIEGRTFRYEGVRNGTWTEHLRTTIPLHEGLPASVFVDVGAENAVGPIFGTCVDLAPRPVRALPA